MDFLVNLSSFEKFLERPVAEPAGVQEMMIILWIVITLIIAVSARGEDLTTLYPEPLGYRRVAVEAGSFAEYVRHLAVLPDTASVRYYDGRQVQQWPGSPRVIDMPFLFRTDVEQCADMALRLVSEYFWETGKADSLAFRLQNGQEISWREWSVGRRLRYDAESDRHVVSQDAADSSRTAFEEFLYYLFHWTGSVALKRDLRRIAASELQPGDLIVQNTSGAMGHVSVILDAAVNDDGERLYLIANGWTPAQSMFIRQPQAGEGSDGWFTLAGYERHLQGYRFGPFELRRF